MRQSRSLVGHKSQGKSWCLYRLCLPLVAAGLRILSKMQNYKVILLTVGWHGSIVVIYHLFIGYMDSLVCARNGVVHNPGSSFFFLFFHGHGYMSWLGISLDSFTSCHPNKLMLHQLIGWPSQRADAAPAHRMVIPTSWCYTSSLDGHPNKLVLHQLHQLVGMV